MMEDDLDTARMNAAVSKIGRILVHEIPPDLIGEALARLAAAWIKGHRPPMNELAAMNFLITHIRRCILFWEKEDKERA